MNRTAHIIPVRAEIFVISFSGPNVYGSTFKELPIQMIVGRIVYKETLTKMAWIHMSRSQTTSAIADAVDRHNESAPADQQIQLKSIATRSYSTSPCPFYNLIKKQDDHTSWEFNAAAKSTCDSTSDSTSDSDESDESDDDDRELRKLQMGYLEMIETDEEYNVADIVAEMTRLNNELDAILQVLHQNQQVEERCSASILAKTDALYQSMAALQARVAARGRLSPPF